MIADSAPVQTIALLFMLLIPAFCVYKIVTYGSTPKGQAHLEKRRRERAVSQERSETKQRSRAAQLSAQADRDAVQRKIAEELELQRIARERAEAMQIVSDAYEQGARDALHASQHWQDEQRRRGLI